MTHTQGPWEIFPVDENQTLLLKQAGIYGAYLYTLKEFPGNGRKAEPNAQLIAAAPELLELLQNLVTATTQWDGTYETFNAVAEAEKKATELIERLIK